MTAAPQPSPGFMIDVKHLDGSTSAHLVTATDTVATLKKRLGGSAGQHRLLFEGRELEAHRLLSDYSIQNTTTLHLGEPQICDL